MIAKLEDARNKRAEEHAAKVLALFRDHPELARNAIILAPPENGGEGITLTPEHMGSLEIIGILESAKFGVLMTLAMEKADG